MTLLGVSMTDVASALPLAGWYDDPADDTRLRWWDGSDWTGNAMPKPTAEAPPAAPPVGPAYSVDEQRVRESPRRAARAAQQATDSEVERLAPVLQLHRTPAPEADDAQLPGSTADEPTMQPQSANPQADVPPSAVAQTAAVVPASPETAPPLEHMPQLGLVPAEVEAPAFDAAASGMAIPAPGTLLAGPALGTLVDLAPPVEGSLIAATPHQPVTAGPSPMVAPEAPAAETAPEPLSSMPAGLPSSPAEFLAATQPEAGDSPARPSLPIVTTALSWDGLVPGRSSTVWGWLLALSPFFVLAAQAGALALYVSSPQLALPIAGGSLGLGLLPFVVAALDRHALKKAGWQHPPSVAFLLLGPFWYLVARHVRLRREGARTGALLAATLLSPLLAAAAAVAGVYWFQETLMSWLVILELRA